MDPINSPTIIGGNIRVVMTACSIASGLNRAMASHGSTDFENQELDRSRKVRWMAAHGRV
jgi:hypothetical protein